MAFDEFLVALVLSGLLHGAELEKVKFPDQLDQTGSKLVLNGVGLRVKRKFGLNFKVYVAGLYLSAKSSQGPELIASSDPKVLRLVFLRSLDVRTLREAWQESYEKNCNLECKATQLQLKEFNDAMVDVQDQSEMRIQFGKDAIDVEVKGKATKSAHVSGEAFRRNLLAVFIGKNPPTEDLKKGLLGNN